MAHRGELARVVLRVRTTPLTCGSQASVTGMILNASPPRLISLGSQSGWQSFQCNEMETGVRTAIRKVR